MADGSISSDSLFRAAQLVLGLKLTLLVLLFDPQSFNVFGVPKSIAGHIASVALLVLLAALYARYRRALFTLTAAHWAALALAGWFIVAAAFAMDRTVAVFGINGRFLGLLQMADNLVTLVAASSLIRRPLDIARFLTASLATAALAAAYGLAQHLDLDPVRFAQGRDLVPVATLGNPDIAGGYLSVAAATALAVALIVGRQLNAMVRVGLLSVSGLAIYVLALTRVRNGVLALGAAFLVIFVLLAAWRGRRSMLVSSVIAVAVGVAVLLSPVAARLTPGALASDPGVQERLEIWQTASSQILSHPLVGVGPDNFGAAYPSTRSERSVQIAGPDVLQSSTHNWLLYIGTSSGLVGAVLFLVFLGLVVSRAVELTRAHDPVALSVVPLAAYLAQGLVDVNDVSLEWIFWFCCGAILYRRSSAVRARAKVASDSLGNALAVAGAVVAAIAVGVIVRPELLAAEAMTRSVAQVAAGRPLDGVESARQAIAFDSRRGQYWSQFGTALSAAGNPSAAASAYEAALEREPWQPIYWRNLGVQRLAQGQLDRAVQSFERAIRADAFDVQSLNLAARLVYAQGDLASALSYGERSARLVPTDPSLYDVPTLAAIRMERFAEVESLLRVGIERTSSPHLKVLLAQLYRAEGRSAEAVALVNEVLAADPSNAEAAELKKSLQ